jgi:hypothetical protein
MFSTLRTRFGIPGVISVIALVFAMFGGAYAASNSSGGGKATASKAKAKKGPRGPKGAKGDTGPAGPQGPAGAAGAKGDNGAAGSNGTDGVDGASVDNTMVPVGDTTRCGKLGGAEFKVAAGAPTYACNGKAGLQGPPGPTCENGACLLPAGATLTGSWGVSASNTAEAIASISYSLRLNEGEEPEVVYVDEATGTIAPECPGSPANPEAAPGFVCVYSYTEANVNYPLFGVTPDYTSGLILDFFTVDPEAEAFAYGTWAVTAEE